MKFTILHEMRINDRPIVWAGPRFALVRSLLIVKNNDTGQVFNSVRANWRLGGRWMTDIAINSLAAMMIAEETQK